MNFILLGAVFFFLVGKSKESDSRSAYIHSFVLSECLIFKLFLHLSVIAEETGGFTVSIGGIILYFILVLVILESNG